LVIRFRLLQLVLISSVYYDRILALTSNFRTVAALNVSMKTSLYNTRRYFGVVQWVNWLASGWMIVVR